MPKAKTAFDKKELKRFVNENGFFCSSMKLDISKNAPEDFAKSIPEGATYFEGVVSNGELNRNGYIIRPKALIDSLAAYMENPIILLQHDTEKPIGQNLAASLRGKDGQEEVFVQGYIFDDMTDGAFGRGLLKALSTGHITKAVEFENVKTGEIMSVEEFRALREEKGYFGEWENDWVMAVTELEWVEYSLVSIPSNRRSMITKRNAIEAYFKGDKFCENALRQIVGNEMDEVEEGEEEETKPTSANEENGEKAEGTEQKTETPPEGEGAENAGETPAAEAEEPAEKSGEGDGAETKPEEGENKVRISKADREKLQAMSELLRQTLEATVAFEEEKKEGDGEKAEEVVEEKKEEVEAKPEEPAAETPKEALPAEGGEEPDGNAAKLEVAPQVKAALETLVSINEALTKEVAELEEKLSKVPNKKGLAIVSQFSGEKKEENKPAAGQALMSFLRSNGFNV